ncbi:MAG: glutathione peroxidase [Myxococcales bacterium]|nr:glutathione peroxidase [Myxococcales bacterium]
MRNPLSIATLRNCPTVGHCGTGSVCLVCWSLSSRPERPTRRSSVVQINRVFSGQFFRAPAKSSRFCTVAHCLLGGSRTRGFASRLHAGFQSRIGRVILARALIAVSLTVAAVSCGWKEVRVAPAQNTAASPFSGGRVIDHTVIDIHGNSVQLSSYRGKALLIVNVASQCGLTPQYEGLQKLYGDYKDKGLEILGFPCNDFAGQEPGSNAEIASFCSSQFKVSFPLFDKVRAKGEKSPLYKTLTEEIEPSLRGEIKWNFTKFLVNRHGQVVARFEPKVEPLDPQVLAQVDAALAAK